MLRADLLDHVNAFLMVYGPCLGEPFGGIPVVLFGDPYQLPPVAPLEDGPLLKDYQSVEKFFFDARAYQGFTEIELTKVFRQAEGDYLNVLNGIRDGTISDPELALLEQRVVPDVSPRYLKDNDSTMLTARNEERHRVNAEILEPMPGPRYRSDGVVNGVFPEAHLPNELHVYLKPGAKIMTLVNKPPLYVNGTLATILRATPEGIVVALPGGREEEVPSHTWYRYQYDFVEGELQQMEVGRFTQLPVCLAWSMTMHKSQGLTLPRAVVNLEKIPFANGQLYVGLSRVPVLEGLTLTPRTVHRSDIRVSREAHEFMQRITHPMEVA
jgi:hypothetical protein